MRLKYPDLPTTVERECPSGHAQVLRCYPLHERDGILEPFPTLFWLACPHLSRELARLEAEGCMRDLLHELRADPDFRARLADDHRICIRERWELLDSGDQERIERAGLAPLYRERGIGGMRNFAAVKCLHLHYAHHLARGNAIGQWLDERALVTKCSADFTDRGASAGRC